MKRCELLSPAGNMDMLKYAILYGTDAVYLAGTKFGARKFANNFNDKELKEAVEYAHQYGVKIYLTINTLIYEREIEEFLNYVEYIHKIGVDAVLVQDFGMLKLLRSKFPDLEIHASTQMHNNGKNMLKLLKKYSVKRVVLDREMSLSEIEKLPDDIEKEVFCHGALCVSYSGQCLFSSMILRRSGNRGECAGMCRLPYRLEVDGKIVDNNPKYYLSLKDLCIVNELDKILDAGVDCIKIEGRMKSPEYVGYMTKIYRELIDSYYEGKIKRLNPKEMNNIKLLFNRGLTKGFISDEENANIANIESPNHIGIHLGRYKVLNTKVELTLDDELHQGDAIRFQDLNKGMTVNFIYDKKDKLINSSQKGTVVYVDNFLDIKGSGELRKVRSIVLENEINNLPERKVKIDGKIVLKKGKNITLEITDGNNKVLIAGAIPEQAKNRPITELDVRKQILKTGNTIYEFANIKIDLEEGLFVNLKDLNEIRRKALDTLHLKRISVPEIRIFKNPDRIVTTDKRENELNVMISNLEQYNIVKKYATSIFIRDRKLYDDLKKFENVYFKYDENKNTQERDKYMVSDYGSLECKNENDIIHTDYMLNVVNSYSIENLISLGATTICLSPELSLKDIISLQSDYRSSYVEVLIYGNIELMKMKYSPASSNEKTYLIDRNNAKYLIKTVGEKNYCMSHVPIDFTENIDELLNVGVKNYRVDFLKEDASTCEKIMSKIHKKIF